MKIRFSRLLNSYYSVILLFLFLSLSYSVYTIWQSDFANSDKATLVYKVSAQVDSMREQKIIENAQKSLISGREVSAIKLVNVLSQEATDLNEAYALEEHESLQSHISGAKKEIQGLRSLPRAASVFLVLSRKLAAFEKLAIKNRWPTLTTLSSRSMTRAKSITRDKGRRDYNSIHNAVRYINGNLKRMRNVTRRSFLPERKKKIIYSRLDSIGTEIKMLTRHSVMLKNSNLALDKLEERYNLWVDGLAQKVAVVQIGAEKRFKGIVVVLLVILVFTALALVAGFSIYNRSEEMAQKKVESLVMDVVTKGLLQSGRQKFEGEFSNTFCNDLDKYYGYIKKRTSFSTIFQEALPFSALLLDSNLNIVWGNNVFYEQWGLDKSSETNISWGYLSQFTNLGENDPIMAALHDDVAGIYNIQIRRSGNKSEEGHPFEMYVSSVDHYGDKRIMILFYPLKKLEEELASQTKAIVGPVVRAINAISEGSYTSTFKDDINKDFNIAGISDVFSKIDSLNSLVGRQQEWLMSEIVTLENSLNDKTKSVSDIRIGLGFESEVFSAIEDVLRSLKQSIISTLSYQDELQSNSLSVLDVSEGLINDSREILHTARRSAEVIKESKDLFSTIVGERDVLKAALVQVDDSRKELSRMLERAGSTIGQNSRVGISDRIFSDLEDEVKKIEDGLSLLGRSLQSMGLALSKVKMTMADGDSFDFERHASSLHESKDNLGKRKTLLRSNTQHLTGGMEKVVDRLQDIKKLMNDVRKNSNEMISLTSHTGGMSSQEDANVGSYLARSESDTENYPAY